MKKFAFALESDEVVEEVTPEMPAEEIMESTAEIDDVHEDMMESSEEVGELHEAMSEGAEASDTLVDLGDAMAEKVEDGEGMSEDAAKIAEVAIESIRVRLGLPKSQGKIPSLESFKAPRSRVEATRIALESVSEMAKKLWAKIVEFCKAIWEKIKNYIGTLLKNYGALEAHLEVLKKKAATISGEPSAAELAKPNLAKFFTMGGEANFSTAEKSLMMVGKFAEGSEKVLNFVEANSDFEKMSKMDPSAASAEVMKHFTGLKQVFESAGFEGPVPGDEVIKIVAADGKFDVEFESGKSPAKEIKALSKEEIAKLLDTAIAQAKKGKDLKKVSDTTEKALKKIIAAAESVGKMAGDEKTKENSDVMKQLSGAANSYAKVVSKVSAKMPQLHFSTVKYAGDYAAAGIMNFKKMKEEKTEEKK